MSAEPHVFLLKCAVQTYHWGKYGLDSEVAKLLKEVDTSFKVDDKSTYAELWMGTHPRGPSVIINNDQTLSNWLEQHPECGGQRVVKVFPPAGNLPFLFKVLSVNMALSIQVHPDKAMAERLHHENPKEYPDDNHKPEMAIALTPFEALCGFRPVSEVVSFLDKVPELRAIVGDSLATKLAAGRDKPTFRECFSALMLCDESRIKQQLSSLVVRLSGAKMAAILEDSLADVLLRLHGQFPGDVGCFCIYFFNHVVLQPGQAIFLEANLPHAYLSGDCLECMACSDNVVRAGLTPKLKDVTTLCSILNYRGRPAAENFFPAQQKADDPHVTVYDPPVRDFTVEKIDIPVGVENYAVRAVDGPSIVLVLKGIAQGHNETLGRDIIPLRRGSVVFVSANETLKLSNMAATGLLMFKAFCVV